MSAVERLGIDSGALAPAGEHYCEHQRQSADCFGFKWKKPRSYSGREQRNKSREWLLERYCSGDSSLLDSLLAVGRKIFLDAGCGSGYSASLFFGDKLKTHDYLGVDISDSVETGRESFKELGYPGDFIKSDLMRIPVPDCSIDMIFSEGVLHHTDDTWKSLEYLTVKLKKNGRFLFYVYNKKAKLREYSDDLIREQLKEMSNEKAWEILKPLTELGLALGEIDADIEIKQDIPLLGIKAGKMSIQRFFYWNVCKVFYRNDIPFDQMNSINFDWFRPLNCHRHTPEEVCYYCEKNSLEIENMNVQPSGTTVVAVKK